MGLYANLIHNNWSYYATKTTKVKKPYLEKLIFRNLQADLIILFGLVGLFPKLNDVNVIPQLQLFHLHYTKPGNEQNEMKVIVEWLGRELTKNHVPFYQDTTGLQYQNLFQGT